MYEIYSPYLQSEMNYRRDRMRSTAVLPKTRRHRIPRLRRSASAGTDAR